MTSRNKDEYTDNITLEEFKLFEAKALKSYLHIRGKSTEGTFDELAARAFVAHTENSDVVTELEEDERSLSDVYKSKLIIEDVVIPDPISLKDNWIGEKKGITTWPSIFYNNIADHLSMLGSAFIKHLEREYKLGKSYRYYTSKFLREVFINQISPDSKYCILRTRVIPSHNTSMTPYWTWVVATKDQGDDNPGGFIHAAYCTCVAGLSGTCNHVTALLFRIDAAVTTGVTNPSKTSILCSWNVPSGNKIDLKPMAASDMIFAQKHFTRDTDRDLEEEKRAFLAFSPNLNENRIADLSDVSSLRQSLYDEIKGEIPNSRLSELMEGKQLNIVKPIKYDIPSTLMEARENFTYDNDKSLFTNVTNFIKTIQISEKQVKDLKMFTSSQASSNDWFNHRIGRITASNFHRVFTRAKSLKANGGSAEALVEALTTNEKIDTKALRHGRALEPLAIRKYEKVEKKNHQNFNVKRSGLVVFREFPYIGASPDSDIECSCCGKGVLEIKCPYSISNQAPSASNLPYLTEFATITNDERITKLTQNHQYHFQVQGQMAITNTNYCDFFVYTKFGFHLERILFNKDFWEKLLANLTWFWLNYVGPKLITQKPTDIKNDSPSQKACSSNPIKLITLKTLKNKTKDEKLTKNIKVASSKRTKKTSAGKSKKQKSPVYICGVCKQILIESPGNFAEESVGCDRCPLWFHFKCVNISELARKPKPKDLWLCPTCTKSVKKDSNKHIVKKTK